MTKFAIVTLLALGLSLLASAAETQPKPATAPEWQKLSADEKWYLDSKEKEQVFSGKLVKLPPPPEVSTLMRTHIYRLGTRDLYPGKENAALEALVGQNVEIKGKPYDIALEGQGVSEIWAGWVRKTPAETK